MTDRDERERSNGIRVIMVVLGSVLALVLPFVVMSQFFGTGGTGGTADTGQLATNSPALTTPAVGARITAGTASTKSPPVVGATTTTTGTPMAPELAQAQESCRLANLRQQAPLSAADVSMAQFEKHIDAMNLLVAGKISLSVATTFWDQTRVGAMQKAAAFHAADMQLRTSTARCVAPSPAVANASPYGQVVQVLSCAAAIKAHDAALARARTVVATWEHHVHDMELLRMGKITPAQASAAWRKNWKTGALQLQAYQNAASAATKTSCPLE